VIEDGTIITTTVPDPMKRPGKMIYFQPEAVKPKICTANVSWYIEVQMRNASNTGCLE
jgi:hypothetical protein